MASEPADLTVAVGLALGHHIEAYRSLTRCPLIIFEPSLARLKAALSIRPLPFLGEPDVVLVTDLAKIPGVMASYYRTGLSLRVCLHPSAMRLEPDAVRELLDQIKRSKSSADVGTKTRVAALAAWSWQTVSNARRIADAALFSELDGIARGVPAVVVAAGPSLDKQLPLLREYRDRVIVICIGQALGSLRRAGIEPDLVHVIESKPVLHQLEGAGSTENLNLVLSPDSHPELFEAPVRSLFVATPLLHAVARWVATQLGSRSFVMGGATVAQGSIGLAVALGANPVMLIGQDLAFTDGRAYAKGSAYESVRLDFIQGEDGSTTFLKRNREQRELVGEMGGKDRVR